MCNAKANVQMNKWMNRTELAIRNLLLQHCTAIEDRQREKKGKNRQHDWWRLDFIDVGSFFFFILNIANTFVYQIICVSFALLKMIRNDSRVQCFQLVLFPQAQSAHIKTCNFWDLCDVAMPVTRRSVSVSRFVHLAFDSTSFKICLSFHVDSFNHAAVTHLNWRCFVVVYYYNYFTIVQYFVL